jgi:hypothetical protein
MAPRWVRTADLDAGNPHSPFRGVADDFALLSGGLVVGRVYRSTARGAWQWSRVLRDPTARGAAGGEAPALKEAKDALLASWRAWQSWASVKDAD